MSRLRQLWPLTAWFASLVVAIVAFTAMGKGALAGPDLSSPQSWGEWFGATEPVVAVVALLRLVVVALAWYLVGVTTIGAIARFSRDIRLVRVADALSIPTVRRLLQSTLGMGLATAMVAASATTSVSPRTEQTPPVMAMAGDETAASAREDATGVAVDAASGDPPAMRRLESRQSDVPAVPPAPPALQSRNGPTVREASEAPPEATPSPDAPAPPTTEDPAPSSQTHTVVAGEHLWAIAESALAERIGRAPTDEEVVPFWEQLIELNRERLADPSNPDLIFPGQEFVLPTEDG